MTVETLGRMLTITSMSMLAGLLNFAPPSAPPPASLSTAEAPIEPSTAKWVPGNGVEVSTQDQRFSLSFGMMGQLQIPITHTPAQPAMGITPVLGYYFARHFLKLQLDYLHLWNDDIRLGTDQVRLQLQATF